VGPLAFIAEYLPEDEPLLAARANAADLGGTEPVSPAVGAALRFLACAAGARTAVEIGTGCGSSGIWLLRGMRPGSTLTSVDTEPEYQRVARKTFTQAGFAQNQSRLILGRALDVLPRLSDGAYDLVFCDADPRDYLDYLSAALRLLRTGGIVVFNNALLAAPGDAEEAQGVLAVDLASQVRADERLVPVLLPLGDGLLAAIKRAELAAARSGDERRGDGDSDDARARTESSDHGLQGVTKPGRLVGCEFNNQPAPAFQRDPHDDTATFLSHLKRTVTRPRLHRRHSPIPFPPHPTAQPIRDTGLPGYCHPWRWARLCPGADGGTGQPQSFLSVALLSRVRKQIGNDRPSWPTLMRGQRPIPGPFGAGCRASEAS
jgi:predicted O-methyltransferase YrrM